ncbi:putative topoisomerase ii-associated protein pat1 protein [Eutypa lata UCREL1]|uniref:Putative topoisomerase ii-associated protein pat1 protein n=1 Tax=Eutypa lata (strain UCR-EL1) TaxID=1287681 RepID=M7SQD5_EUTLA|nr:putative topoisomerase ii-associated protein pat1 protein [Eutypa lata UCREL1]
MAHNPSQPGAQPGMPQQMAAAHMGVSGPGGQVNPAAMMGGGMAPGAGPNAHAMHHLNPQMFQQQQQFALANNPNMVALQQQRVLQQRQLMAQQMGYGNIGANGIPMNMNMNAAQFAAMRNNNMRQVGMPPHMQQAHLQQQGQHPNPQQHAQMMAQQIAMQQHQQAANNQMQQGGQPHPTQANQPQQPQGPNQHPNQPQNQPQQPNPQMLHTNAAQQHQLANNIQHQLQQQQKNAELKGHCLLKLMLFAEHLSGYPGTSKQYEIAQPALARYFHTHFTSGMRNMQLTFDKGTVDKSLSNGSHFIENPKASLIYWYDNSHVVANGSLRASFDPEQKIELLEFHTESHDEYISRKMVIERALPAHNWVKDWHKVNSQDTKLSPEISKKGKSKVLKSPQNPPPDLDLPDSAVKHKMGITEAVFQFLEIVEVMGQMNSSTQPLFQFYHTHPNLSPIDALKGYVSSSIPDTSRQGVVVNGQHQGNIPPGPRTPNFAQFPMGASPAATHLQLPGSPSMGSPAQGHMQAPGMALQQSQQGTNSSGPSANTSPASNKRRRPSGVKTEDESGAPTPASMGAGPQVNGVTMAGKKPPTPRMQKRLKGNPA